MSRDRVTDRHLNPKDEHCALMLDMLHFLMIKSCDPSSSHQTMWQDMFRSFTQVWSTSVPLMSTMDCQCVCL